MDLVLRVSFNSNCALEFNRGLKWVKYIAHTGNGPRVFSTRVADFEKEFYRTPSYDPRTAALRFLDAAKRAYEHDEEVLTTLLEILKMGKSAADMNVAELTVAYNDLAKTLGRPTRKNFKNKADALAAIEVLDAEAKKATPAQKATAGKKEDAAAKRKAANGNGEAKEKKPRGPGIGAFCKGLISKGKTNPEILEAVAAQFPGAKTTAGCLAYYRNKMKAAEA